MEPVTLAADPRVTRPAARSPGPADRHALVLWLAAHLGVLIYMLLVAPDGGNVFERLTPWDAENFIAIAEHGYDGPPGMPDPERLTAFFPGMPLLLRLLDPFFADLRVAIVLVSFVAGAVAVVALSRLSEAVRPGSGPWTVLAFLLSPFAVFLYAGYSEALFLACALPAWLLARQGRWTGAVLCAAGASLVRISGLFLAFALIVEFAIGPHGLRDPAGRRRVALLAVPVLPVFGYLGYQWWRTGDMLAWKHAEEVFWGRTAVWPWEALANTWERSLAEPVLAVSYRQEICAAAVLALLTAALLARRRWAEAAYIAPQAAAFLTLSSFYLSVGRASLLWWPLWLALGTAGARRPWLYALCLAVTAPVMAVNVGSFTTGAWVG